MKDMKEALSSGRKPDITHVRTPLLNYVARACEYGSAKYERANYDRPVDGDRAAFERLRAYLRACLSHTVQTLDAMERHQALDPQLEDSAGMKAACFAADTDPDTSGKVGPSGLPHLCGAAASLNMALEQAANAGLLPADPGQPWVKPAAACAINCRCVVSPAPVTDFDWSVNANGITIRLGADFGGGAVAVTGTLQVADRSVDFQIEDRKAPYHRVYDLLFSCYRGLVDGDPDRHVVAEMTSRLCDWMRPARCTSPGCTRKAQHRGKHTPERLAARNEARAASVVRSTVKLNVPAVDPTHVAAAVRADLARYSLRDRVEAVLVTAKLHQVAAVHVASGGGANALIETIREQLLHEQTTVPVAALLGPLSDGIRYAAVRSDAVPDGAARYFCDSLQDAEHVADLLNKAPASHARFGFHTRANPVVNSYAFAVVRVLEVA